MIYVPFGTDFGFLPKICIIVLNTTKRMRYLSWEDRKMRNVCLRKVLVVGIIVLFLGVGFQPAFANEINTTIVSDVDEDCLECQPVNNVDILRVRLLVIRIKAITNVILSRFGYIPEVKEKCEEVLELINSGVLLLFCVIILVWCELLVGIMVNLPKVFWLLFIIPLGIPLNILYTYCM